MRGMIFFGMRLCGTIYANYSMSLPTGIKAPQFSLPDQDGVIRSLSDYKGKWVLLYFYPKDNTPGCTTEACTIRDSFDQFKPQNAVVLGVSADSVASHKKFVNKHTLPFLLLSDEQKIVLQAYKVWKKKSFLGRTFLSIHRMSYLINPKGELVKIYEKVKPESHAQEVLNDILVFSQ